MSRANARFREADRRKQSYIEPPFNEADVCKAVGWAKSIGIKVRGSLTPEGSIRLAPIYGFVYFVQSGDFVKIGYASDVQSRMAGLQTGSPHPLKLIHSMPGNEPAEKRMHFRFRDQRHHGEWFRLEGALAEFLERKNT